MIEKKLVVGPFQCNCRILACPDTGEAVVIDPGHEAKRILDMIQGAKTESGKAIQVKYLLHTHGHFDHIGGTRGVREGLDLLRPRIALHKEDENLYTHLQMQGQFFGYSYDAPLPIDHYLEDGEELKIGSLKLSMIHTPGHSPGSICIRLHESSAQKAKETLFSGDTLFQGSVGRTDLIGGNHDLMFKSIHNRILVLDGDTRVCPGHGPDTSVATEKRTNPFLR